jgi:hypothetical protein
MRNFPKSAPPWTDSSQLVPVITVFPHPTKPDRRKAASAGQPTDQDDLPDLKLFSPEPE